jgi:hypothetical protein
VPASLGFSCSERGARLGLQVGIFVVCEFAGTNYSTLNIGRGLALQQAAAAPIEFPIMGALIGFMYKPAAAAVIR